MVSNVDICSTALPDEYACAFTASAAATVLSVGAGGGAVGEEAVCGAGFTGPGRSSTLALRAACTEGGDVGSPADGVVEVEAARRKDDWRTFE